MCLASIGLPRACGGAYLLSPEERKPRVAEISGVSQAFFDQRGMIAMVRGKPSRLGMAEMQTACRIAYTEYLRLSRYMQCANTRSQAAT